mmetsp:Transcript_113088/g.314785  ORF Transcript_113088/g.314785 Transcript_113088/m.314785 type:complete len:273 (+) Transcript_113088:1603-2421(+)
MVHNGALPESCKRAPIFAHCCVSSTEHSAACLAMFSALACSWKSTARCAARRSSTSASVRSRSPLPAASRPSSLCCQLPIRSSKPSVCRRNLFSSTSSARSFFVVDSGDPLESSAPSPAASQQPVSRTTTRVTPVGTSSMSRREPNCATASSRRALNRAALAAASPFFTLPSTSLPALRISDLMDSRLARTAVMSTCRCMRSSMSCCLRASSCSEMLTPTRLLRCCVRRVSISARCLCSVANCSSIQEILAWSSALATAGGEAGGAGGLSHV